MNTVYIVVDGVSDSDAPIRYSLKDGGEFMSMGRFEGRFRWEIETIFKNPENMFVFVGGFGSGRGSEALEKVLHRYFSFPITRAKHQLLWPKTDSGGRHISLELDKGDSVISIRQHGLYPFADKEMVSVYDMLSFSRFQVKEEKLPPWAREKISKRFALASYTRVYIGYTLKLSDDMWVAMLSTSEYQIGPYEWDGDWYEETELCLITRNDINVLWSAADVECDVDNITTMHLSRTGKSLVVKGLEGPKDRQVFLLSDYIK